MRRLRYLILLALLCIVETSVGQEIAVDSLRQFDLLFVVNPDGNAITESTTATGQLPIDHVGYLDQGCVREAIPGKGVTLTKLSDFMKRNIAIDGKPHIFVGRINTEVHLSDELASRYDAHIPYDSLYDPDDSAMYCSELVQKCFVLTDGKAVFPTIPMSFHDADGHITSYWKAFYARHGKSVPEGMSGTNPGQLSREKVVHIRLSRVF